MLRDNRLYRTWCGMKKRCYNPNAKDYKYYGGKGITVCDEWLHNFSAFESWSIANGYSDELTIDRIDSNSMYCPNNCRWITHAEQQKNRTITIRIVHKGIAKTISEWSDELKISYKLIYSRYRSALQHKGYCTLEDIQDTPKYQKIYTERYKNRSPKPSNKIRQYTLDGEYIGTFTFNEAEAKGFSKRAIHNCCSGRSKTACGYIWKRDQ